MTPDPDWRHLNPYSHAVEMHQLDAKHRLTVTAPRTAEQALSLISAGVSALDGVAMTDDEKERVWALVNKAMERLK